MVLKNLKKIDHLVRYFIMLGIAVFVAYVKNWNDQICLYLIAPPFYLAYFLKNFIKSIYTALPNSIEINHFAFLMPITFLYFGLAGGLLKTLWNERGFLGTVSLAAFCVFVIYIHYMTGSNLLGYFVVQR